MGNGTNRKSDGVSSELKRLPGGVKKAVRKVTGVSEVVRVEAERLAEAWRGWRREGARCPWTVINDTRLMLPTLRALLASEGRAALAERIGSALDVVERWDATYPVTARGMRVGFDDGGGSGFEGLQASAELVAGLTIVAEGRAEEVDAGWAGDAVNVAGSKLKPWKIVAAGMLAGGDKAADVWRTLSKWRDGPSRSAVFAFCRERTGDRRGGRHRVRSMDPAALEAAGAVGDSPKPDFLRRKNGLEETLRKRNHSELPSDSPR